MSVELPLVSILMTAYNREKFIGEAIESVLDSTYQNFELIIVDDCSVDNTLVIAREYSLRDERIAIHVNEDNLGQFPNRNHASDLANGVYMIYVDSDDKILKDGIKELVNIMELHPLSSFGMYAPHLERVEQLEPGNALKKHFFEKPFLTHGPGGTILKRSFFREIGKYPLDYGIPGDMFFNLKACCYTPITLIPNAFMYYRRHEGQEINNSYDYLYNNYKYLRDALTSLPLPITGAQKKWLLKKSKRRFVVNIAKYYYKTLSFKKTAYAIKEAKFSLKDMFQGIFHT